MRRKTAAFLLMLMAAILAVGLRPSPMSLAVADSGATGPLAKNPNNFSRPIVDKGYYSIVIDKETQVLTVLRRDSHGKYTIIDQQMACSTGRTPGRTPVGSFEIYGTRYRWRASNPQYHEYMQYASRINGVILIHSVTYHRTDVNQMNRDSYLDLGKPVSAGCIRLTVRDAKWIYTNCPNDTVVKVVKSGGPSVVSLNPIPALPANATWDPTDVNAGH